MLYKRILSTGNSINNIKVCIDLLDNCKDPDILDEFLINVFIDNLRTEESKLTAINLLDEKFVEVKVRMTPEQRSAVQAHAQNMGESTTVFINRAISETMERDKGASV